MKKFVIGYRVYNTAPIYIHYIDAESLAQAECKFNLLHCKNKLKHATCHMPVKIEFSRESE